MNRAPRRHDTDAGGPAGVLAAKAARRDDVWKAMSQPGVTRFPGPRNRIPNFVGAEDAARRLQATPAWNRAGTVKANPDAPQWPVRQRALEDGKVLYMAVPRLAEAKPFFLLDPEHITGSPRSATSIKGAARSARMVGVDELQPVDLVVAGSVAVGEDGARLGKGGGFSDLELALAAEAGLVDARTVIATTVHDVQVRPAGDIPVTAHDFAVDLVVTPTRVLEVRRGGRRPLPRVRWDELTDEKIAAIPLLQRLRPAPRH
ncbi:MAG: 5-formyltetrahydrofolate cyclo-ligase [Actinobacteria bacterium]|nr:5-formyltetrahydrofolate cyclo-ligase [Actinomycetota bacterium]